MCVRGLYVFTHHSERGNAPAHRLFELLSVKPCGQPPRQFSDYSAVITDLAEGPVKSLPDFGLKEPLGVTLSVLTGLKPTPHEIAPGI
jgi:hypothetical protein